MTLQERLNHERADIHVSGWLQEIWNHLPDADLAHELRVAYRVDQFLQHVNMDGLDGYFENNADDVDFDLKALREIGLDEAASRVEEGINGGGID
ncbi:MAG: DMP19 family protein [Fimbriimonadales bacterium]